LVVSSFLPACPAGCDHPEDLHRLFSIFPPA